MKPESVRLKSIPWPQYIPWLAAFAVLVFVHTAQARVTCTISSAGFSTAYGTTLNVTASSFTVTCSHLTGAGSTATYQVAASNGLQPTGTQNRAASGVNFLNYNLTSDPACLTPWKGTVYIPAAAYTTPVLALGASDVKTYSFYGCVPAGQTVPAAGTYTDTVTMSFIPGGAKFTNGTFPVSITAPATCTLSTPPGNIVFNYTSFSAAPVLANTTFAATCTNRLPYTLALDATSGTIAGVSYTLALSAASATGTGLAQTYTINGTIAAGQSGTCAAATCTGSQTRTLTITY